MLAAWRHLTRPGGCPRGRLPRSAEGEGHTLSLMAATPAEPAPPTLPLAWGSEMHH